MKFDSNRLGMALAGALSATFTVCVLVCTFLPNFAMHLGHGLVHHHMLVLTVNEYLCGLVQTAVYAYVIGFFFAYCYNNLSK
jgi:hypothetical protein